jgi:hypothetical protein
MNDIQGSTFDLTGSFPLISCLGFILSNNQTSQEGKTGENSHSWLDRQLFYSRGEFRKIQFDLNPTNQLLDTANIIDMASPSGKPSSNPIEMASSSWVFGVKIPLAEVNHQDGWQDDLLQRTKKRENRHMDAKRE